MGERPIPRKRGLARLPRTPAPNLPPLHDLDNPRRLRNDIEALLRTYDEVKEVWPQGKSDLWIRLVDGRQITITVAFRDAPEDTRPQWATGYYTPVFPDDPIPGPHATRWPPASPPQTE